MSADQCGWSGGSVGERNMVGDSRMAMGCERSL